MLKKRFEEIKEEIYDYRNKKYNKSDFGRVLLIGSSRRYPLSVLISEKGAKRVGNGYLALSVPEDVYPIVASRAFLTTIFEPLTCEGDSFVAKDEKELAATINRYDAILFGNGIEVSQANYDFLAVLIRNYHKNLVLDASALSLLSQFGNTPLEGKNEEETILLTPHLGEARKLFKQDYFTAISQYFPYALQFNQKYKTRILLKSFKSYLINEEKSVLSSSYAVALAKAGSGDGLAGYITGVLGYPVNATTEEKILFADEMIHKASILDSKEKNEGTSDILTALDRIPV